MPIIVFVTIPSGQAQQLAKVLLAARICACVNITAGIKSFFWWEGKIDEADEAMLIIKTEDSLFSKLEETVIANHPYEVPEIIAVNIEKISKPYWDWLLGELNTRQDK